MQRRTLPVAAAVLALAAVILGTAAAADDDPPIVVPKPIRDEVNKMADAVGKGEKIDKAAAAYAKEHEKEFKQTMWVFRPREPEGKGGFGVGAPGKYNPDGIEVLLLNQLGPRPKMTLDPKKNGADLNRLADVTLAMAEITYFYAPTKAEGEKTPAKWKGATEDMKKAAAELKAAVKDENKADLKKAISNLSASCSRCHSVFRP
jgi:cytochrome c556